MFCINHIIALFVDRGINHEADRDITLLPSLLLLLLPSRRPSLHFSLLALLLSTLLTATSSFLPLRKSKRSARES